MTFGSAIDAASSLALEALAELEILGELRSDHLERYDPVKLEIARAVLERCAGADDRLEASRRSQPRR